MTMVFAAASQQFIVMANDCAVVNDFANGRVEYTTGRKFFVADGIGCVTMWGARDGNQLVRHLADLGLDANRQTVDDLAQAVHRYLTEKYTPHQAGIGDTGYHVGGFTPDGEPHLYHIFWNAPGSANAARSKGAYTFELQHPPPKLSRFLYNGRHELASSLIHHFISELNQGKPTRFAHTAAGVCRLAHFVLRFAAELTPEVAPPFLVHLIARSRHIATKNVESWAPVDDAYFFDSIKQVGLA